MSRYNHEAVAGNHPRHSSFDLSHEIKLTADMGQLVPILAMEMVPGDIMRLGNEIVLRAQPLVAPVLHEVNVFVHYYFVPYRILWDDWEEYITGGQDGDIPELAPPLPKIASQVIAGRSDFIAPGGVTEGSVLDYLGYPVGMPLIGANLADQAREYKYPAAWPALAYYKVYNDYYRDQDLTEEYDIYNPSINPSGFAPSPLPRSWEKDYFTSAAPWQQRGVSPALPLAGLGSAVFNGPMQATALSADNPVGYTWLPAWGADDPGVVELQYVSGATSNDVRAAYKRWLNDNTIDMSNVGTFDVNDLRVAFQLQRWAELSARSGVRYTEFLQAHYGVSPRDDRLQRPEYIGGTRTPLIISEVLQTSETDTSPQGNLAGHGITVDKQRVGSYRAQEFGVLLGIMSIMPRPGYHQGISRMWLKETRYDYFNPAFIHLSEQEIFESELYQTDVTQDVGIFGFNGRYDELRSMPNRLAGQMHSTYNYWHLVREFGNVPKLNRMFTDASTIRKDIFAVPSEPGFVVNFGNTIHGIRPIPAIAQPGLIDHVR